MSKHVEGPWVADPPRDRQIDIRAEGFGVVCTVWMGATDDPRIPANVRVIEAGTDMLAALKKCAAVMAGETLTKRSLIEALEAAVAAIKKAEGEP